MTTQADKLIADILANLNRYGIHKDDIQDLCLDEKDYLMDSIEHTDHKVTLEVRSYFNDLL